MFGLWSNGPQCIGKQRVDAKQLYQNNVDGEYSQDLITKNSNIFLVFDIIITLFPFPYPTSRPSNMIPACFISYALIHL